MPGKIGGLVCDSCGAFKDFGMDLEGWVVIPHSPPIQGKQCYCRPCWDRVRAVTPAPLVRSEDRDLLDVLDALKSVVVEGHDRDPAPVIESEPFVGGGGEFGGGGATSDWDSSSSDSSSGDSGSDSGGSDE